MKKYLFFETNTYRGIVDTKIYPQFLYETEIKIKRCALLECTKAGLCAIMSLSEEELYDAIGVELDFEKGTIYSS